MAFDTGLHDDPVAPVALALAVILIAAKVGGSIAVRLRQPAVLGELIAGIAIGNLHLLGFSGFQPIESNPTVAVLASLGAIILLFEIGLESTVRDMVKVGLSSLLVAVLGVAAPFALGWWAGAVMLPDRSVYVHVFLGATLTATSVGVTARILRDLGQSQSREARIIMGAAVIDDVLGLVILSVVSAVIVAANVGGVLSVAAVGWLLLKAFGFLVGALVLGSALSPRLFSLASRLHGQSVLLVTSLVLCFVLAYLASLIGLAAIVGAYAAGLILERAHYSRLEQREQQHLQLLVTPIAGFLVPVFFVLMGMRVELAPFARSEILVLAGSLTIAAIVGKQVCALGAVGKGIDRLTIGLGMIPRGEVGLIFANIGLSLHVGGVAIVDEGIYSAVVIMVVVTTMATPLALKWSLNRAQRSVTGV